ncbi:MAG: adenylate/guanylate cyclase domain-containing protein [Acidobacteriota bacterium]|nr:adenylate/guanylate cyclase domain-containing protein [Acidobacteriota bacterium]
MPMAKDDLPAPLIDGPGIPFGLAGNWPIHLRNFVVRYLEVLFIIIVAVIVVAVFYFLPYKIAFLNLFYLPVLSAAYFLGRRKAVMSAVLCLLSGVLFAYYRPDWFSVGDTRIDALLVLGTWGGFLILASASVGALQERLAHGFEQTRQLYEELKRTQGAEEMKEKVEKTLYASMDPVVAKLVTEGKLRFEKREISIMFAELTNFTGFSDANRPEVVLEELNRFLGYLEPISDLFRGHIDKYMGDGVMVEFGAPVDYDQHALLAVLAGLRMQERLKKFDMPWGLRVGIATGSAIVGMLGVRRQAYSALGDRVNIAKRLEEICEAEKIYIDEPTFKAVEPFVTATKVRNLAFGRESDQKSLEQLTALEEKLRLEGENAQLLFELGQICFRIHDATAAIGYFGRALALDPNSTEIKLAYADANIKRDDFEKIQLKGKLQKIEVYEVIGIKDRWMDPRVIPPALAAKYRSVESLIEVPEDPVLAVEALDGSVGHSRVVALLSYAMADRLGLNDGMKKAILCAGYLQNIGKEAVPHRILNSVSSLTDQESDYLEKYVPASVAACRRMGFVDSHVLEIVLHQHEMWNGKGYPGQLRGEAIPLGARITAVADSYSALTSWRPYREEWDSRVALNEIRKGGEKGRFDPKVVEVLDEVLRSGN